MAQIILPQRTFSSLQQLPRAQRLPWKHKPIFRHFSYTAIPHLRSTELNDADIATFRSNPARLWADIHNTADRYGTGRRYGEHQAQTGLSRLTLTDSDKQARDWFQQTVTDLGCKVTVDSIGNTFAVRPGRDGRRAPIVVGSHLDSQPLGGRFDGVLGVCAGIEMLRVINDRGIETEAPVGVANWTNEEGARFPVSMMGSGVWAGARDLEEIYSVPEVSVGEGGNRRSVREELERIGYLGDTPANVQNGGVPLGAHFELHIEQGPRLEAAERNVGVVTGVQAYEWYEVRIQGRASHAGTTPMELRDDPLDIVLLLLNQVRTVASLHQGLASIGIIRVEPGSVNTTPDEVMLTLDVRHESGAKLEEMVAAIKETLQTAVETHNRTSTRGKGIQYTMKKTFASTATYFDPIAISCIEKSIQAVTGEPRVMRLISGAGHDSVNTAKHCPTAMVFVPCRNGLSHHPEEWAEQEDCATGTDVIIQSVLRFDLMQGK